MQTVFAFLGIIFVSILIGNGIVALSASFMPKPIEQPIPTYRTVYLEGCQYIEVRQETAYSLCHKGNCNNQIHKCK
jgi:hypothetical protein